MAELTGQYQNFSFIGRYLPILWILYTWCGPSSSALVPSQRSITDKPLTCASRVKVMLIRIPFGFLRTFGPRIWQDINRYEDMIASGKLSLKSEVTLPRYFY